MQGISSCLSVIVLAFFTARIRAEDYHTAQAPLPPDEAARTMVVPEGFQVTLFAGEPDVQQPIGFCIDDRGRLWVAEAYNYPNHGTEPGDRILIFEDVDQDGRFDNRTVFYDGLNYVTGIEVGFGGAWVMSPPYFYFIPDRDGDDVPDAEPQVLLDGFGNFANAHNLANGFAWGPDGWLYGTHGRTNWSMIGKPGTPDDQRKRFDGGVYRYHPVRHVWEPYADGTTNPWGIDWNDWGEAFVCNCVNPHLFHVIQGAHYEPWRNRDSSRFAYERIDTIADHLHFVGTANIRDGIGSTAEDQAGGGHAHCGTMIYLGDNWPDSYRNNVFMNNIHGRRINNDILKRQGSGYVASHAPDLMLSRDPWFMGVTLSYGPNGAVFASDWSDTGECHSVKNTRRETGRIYRISYGTPEPAVIDVTKLNDVELANLQLHRNDWYVRHARRLLQERAAAGANMSAVHVALRQTFEEQADVTRKLRALWALHVTGGLTEEFLLKQLNHSDEYVRAWAVTLLCEDRTPPAEALKTFRTLAESGASPLVRLHLASALHRLKPAARWPIAEALALRAEDQADANLPLMLWYGIEPLVNDDLERFVDLAAKARIPLVRRHIARRASSLADSPDALDLLSSKLAYTDDSGCIDILDGILQGLQGQRTVPMPQEWTEAYARLRTSQDSAVRDRAVRLALVFDDPVAMRSLRTEMFDKSAAAADRIRAINALVAKKGPELATDLLSLIQDRAVRSAAIRGLAEYDHPSVAPRLLEIYPSLRADERQDALQTLSARKAWAFALLDAVEATQVPRTDLTAFTARQLRNLGSAEITERVNALWGEVRQTSSDRARLIKGYREHLSPDVLADADLPHGRALFEKTCAKCHRLYGHGGTIGPDLTGSQRTNLDYMLENLIDPSASVARDFQMEAVATTSGRVVTGLVSAETEAAITVQTQNERIVIPLNEVEERKQSNVSMMPDGLLTPLTFEEVCDLIAYLQSPRQVPLSEGHPEE